MPVIEDRRAEVPGRLAVRAMPTSGGDRELLHWAGIDREAIAATARHLVQPAAGDETR